MVMVLYIGFVSSWYFGDLVIWYFGTLVQLVLLGLLGLFGTVCFMVLIAASSTLSCMTGNYGTWDAKLFICLIVSLLVYKNNMTHLRLNARA